MVILKRIKRGHAFLLLSDFPTLSLSVSIWGRMIRKGKAQASTKYLYGNKWNKCCGNTNLIFFFFFNLVNIDLAGVFAAPLMDVCLLLSTAGQTVLAEGQSGTRAYSWYTLSLTVKVSGDSF